MLHESREGVRLTDAELRYIDDLVSPRIRQGQSPYAVIAALREQLPVSSRTLYRLINGGYPGAVHMDLPEAVQIKTKQPLRERNYKVDRDCLNGRKYEDFCTGCLLTLHFAESHFMGTVLLDHRTTYDVKKAFGDLYTKLGPETFRRAFHVILTDNDGKFSDPARLERADVLLTRVITAHLPVAGSAMTNNAAVPCIGIRDRLSVSGREPSRAKSALH